MFSGNVCTTFHAIICKSSRYMNSFFLDAIASWNLFMEIHPHILVYFKTILSLLRPVSKRFSKIHDPVGLRYLFQLRLSLSPLKGHKWWTTSAIPLLVPVIVIIALETRHFLFSRSSHAIQRTALLTQSRLE